MSQKELKTMVLTAILALGLGSCMEKDVYQGPQEDEKEFNEFDFSTVQKNINLEVSYKNSGVEANVYFELYDEMPVTEGEYNYIKRDDISPLFSAYTADNSVFNGTIELPAYVKKVYIYTPAFFAQTLIEAEVVNGAIKAADYSGTEPQTRFISQGRGDSYMTTTVWTPDEYKDARWKTWLGTYDKDRNGAIAYTYDGKLAATNNGNLYTAHTRVINVNKPCPEIYRSYSDMYISENAEVVVTYLGQNTCWNCSMGYYYYKENDKPTNLDEAHVIMLFPNTQDGTWHEYAAQSSAGIDRGTAVQLIYYPNIANGSMENATNTFPAGYRIGFVLANNGWSNRVSGYTDNNRYRAATSEGLSVNNAGVAFNEPRTAVYKYGEWVMISFEDFTADQNFSDVVMTLKSNPVDAITDIPDVNPDDNTTTSKILKGTYAFEDLWPSKGDYDMNDVVARYSYEKVLDADNKIHSESFIFKIFANVASNNNGLAFRLHSNSSVSSAKCFIRKAGEEKFTETSLQHEAADDVYILTDNVKNNMEGEYMVTVDYGTSSVNEESEIDPFIFKNRENNKRWEVHLPSVKPTSKIDDSDFGKSDDASKPDKGIFYVREGAYPFAIFLSGANEKDLYKILQRENESKPIDQLYSGYKGWVESNGTKNTDWYKK